MLLILRKGFLLFALAVFSLILFLPGYTKLQELRDRNRELAEKIKRLEIENALLQQELYRAEKDSLYQEGIIRDKMGIVRKGEMPVKIIPVEDKR
ncbi:MAG: septum formation initiator family protein [Candidatus Omnitrophica bacterium]|nr:septum formation initiator family protein [Candidatus Omnitrophota bacterium]